MGRFLMCLYLLLLLAWFSKRDWISAVGDLRPGLKPEMSWLVWIPRGDWRDLISFLIMREGVLTDLVPMLDRKWLWF